jgi:hypothetical protein
MILLYRQFIYDGLFSSRYFDIERKYKPSFSSADISNCCLKFFRQIRNKSVSPPSKCEINWLVFITLINNIYFSAKTEILDKIQFNFSINA